jgi:hypothetical protein
MPPKPIDPAVKATVEAMSPEQIDFLKRLREILEGFDEIQIFHHFTTNPISELNDMLDEAVAVFPDLEWFNNDSRPYVPREITELGFNVLPMSKLRKCKTPADFKTILAKAQKFHIRIAEHCHLRNDQLGLKDAEQHFLYCETRFVSKENTKKIFIDFLNNIRNKDGHPAPVILVGQGWNNDKDKLIDHWNLRPSKLPGVVKTVKSLARLAQQVGIIPAPDYAAGKPNSKTEEMLTKFGVDFTNIWSHNGANDAVHQMTFALLCMFYSMLFPDTTSGFPKNPAIAEQTINEIFKELETLKPSLLSPDWGVVQYCFYCDMSKDHDAEACGTKLQQECLLCATAPGPENSKYRAKKKRMGHRESRCTHQYSYVVPPLEPYIAANLTPDQQRTFARAKILDDEHVIARFFLDKIMPVGRMGAVESEGEYKARVAAEAKKWDIELTDGEVDYGNGTDSSRITTLARKLWRAREEAGEWKAKYEALLASSEKD